MDTKPLPVVPTNPWAVGRLHQERLHTAASDPTSPSSIEHAKLVQDSVLPSPGSAISTTHDEHSPHSSQILTAASASAAQDVSSLRFRHRLVPSTPDLPATQPRRYRLTKLPATRGSPIWPTDDEPSLRQILEQERVAWLAQSKTIDPSGHVTLFAQDLQPYPSHQSLNEQVPNQQPFGSLQQESDSLPSTYDYLVSRGTKEEQDDDTDNYCQVGYVPARVAQDERHSSNPARISSDSRIAALLQGRRESCFHEGSMNEASRGVASTWNKDLDFLYHPEQSGNTPQVTDSDDPDSTPRASAASRASTSSSIDVNEFKPLPATPSTLRSTIKRFGQKLRNPEPTVTTRNTDIRTKPKRRKRGLRRSMSMWKIFNNNAASSLEHISEEPMGQDFQKKTNVSRATTSSRLQANPDLTRKSVLDERKRKAEALYAEQFSTATKRPKPLEMQEEAYAERPEPVKIAAMRQARSADSSTLLKVQSAPRQTGSAHGITPSCADPASMRCAPTAPDQSFASAPVGSKKPSRSKLEKENQYLRSILRRQGAARQTRRAEYFYSGHLDVNHELDGKQKVKAARSGFMDQDSRENTIVTKLPASVLGGDFATCKDVPPVPQLPPSLQHRGVLAPVSDNVRLGVDTATVKHRAQKSLLGVQAPCSRPLSMVVEATENDNDQDQTSEAKVLRKPSHVQRRTYFDGATDEEGGVEAGCVEQAEPDSDACANTQQWDWPDDVF